MLDKERLRKADVFSGAVIFFAGARIVRQAFKMPMKDSWGGVQNVWFVSPALFPLFVGGIVMVLGALLSRYALKQVGCGEFRKTIRWLLSRSVLPYLTCEATIRFYAVVVLFLSFVYINIPRIDFFLSSILFLVVFITMFYFDDPRLLKRLLFFYLAGTIGFLIYFGFGIDKTLTRILVFATDILALFLIGCYCYYLWMLIRNDPPSRKKYRIALIVSVATPLICIPIFKYFLLVPLPKEGLVVALLDILRYLEF